MLAAIVPSPVARYRAARLAHAVEEWLADDSSWDDDLDLGSALGETGVDLSFDRFDD